MEIEYMKLMGVFAGVGCFVALGYSVTSLLFVSHYSNYEQRTIQSLGKQLSRINAYVDPVWLYQLTIVLVVFFFLLGFAVGGGDLFSGVIFGLFLAGIATVAPRMIISYLIRKRMDKLNRELPAGLDLISSSLRAGLSLHQAISRNLENLPPIMAEEMAIVAHECRLGNSLSEALNHWSERMDLLDVKIIVIASEISLKRGGNLTETFDTLGQLIRQKFVFQKEITTLTSEGRLQALVMTVLPFVMLVIMTIIKREMMIEFMTSNVGMMLIFLVLIMQVTAYFWIRKIVSIEM